MSSERWLFMLQPFLRLHFTFKCASLSLLFISSFHPHAHLLIYRLVAGWLLPIFAKDLWKGSEPVVLHWVIEHDSGRRQMTSEGKVDCVITACDSLLMRDEQVEERTHRLLFLNIKVGKVCLMCLINNSTVEADILREEQSVTPKSSETHKHIETH